MEEPNSKEPDTGEDAVEDRTPRGGDESTTPRGNPEADDEAVRESEEGLDQAGGGH
jgi:hypothetical protein